MAIKDSEGKIVNSRNKVKVRKEVIIKPKFPVGTKVWWINRKSPFDLYTGIVMEEGSEASSVEGINRRAKTKGVGKIPNYLLRKK